MVPRLPRVKRAAVEADVRVKSPFLHKLGLDTPGDGEGLVADFPALLPGGLSSFHDSVQEAIIDVRGAILPLRWSRVRVDKVAVDLGASVLLAVVIGP